MRKIASYAKDRNACYGNFSSFNRIKRSSLVWSDDAVETGECHTDDKRRTALEKAEDQRYRNATVPKRAGRHVDVVLHSQVHDESCV